MKSLPKSFYLQDTLTVARELLGCVLWRRTGRKLLAARIVETEAYLGPNDPASHARRGLRSRRNASMYRDGGIAYVYFTYGMYYCLNVVTQDVEIPEAVLIRAAQPLQGMEVMARNRGKAKREFDLLNGPGKLCQALQIDGQLDGESLRDKKLFITPRDLVVADDDIAATPRIGVDYAGDATHWPLRFFLSGNRYVSMARTPR